MQAWYLHRYPTKAAIRPCRMRLHGGALREASSVGHPCEGGKGRHSEVSAKGALPKGARIPTPP
ncbi:MAG: hypothetical protein WD889_01525 [Candidatus Colwellbacteria bacterium]